MGYWEEMNQVLKLSGVPERTFMGEPMEPIDVLVNSKVSSAPYKETLLKYLDKLSGTECEMVVRALTEKTNKDIATSLIPLFERTDLSEHNLWAVGNALNVIKDKSKIDEYFKICMKSELGIARSEIIRYLGSIKTQRVFELLTELLQDLTVRPAVIEALGRTRNPKAIVLLTSLELESKSIEQRNRATALKRLEKAGNTRL